VNRFVFMPATASR